MAGGEGVLWHRPQRSWPMPPSSRPVRLIPPPATLADDGNGMLTVLLPMVGSLSVVAFAFVVRSTIYLIVAGFMVVAMVGGSIATRVTQKRGGRRRRARDTAAYLAHLADVRHRAQASADVQRAGLAGLHPTTTELLGLVEAEEAIWERRPGDPDFAAVRLGVGAVRATAPVEMDTDSNPLAQPDPDLARAAADLVTEFAMLHHAPVTVPLAQLGVVAIVGDRSRARDLAGSWVASLAALHAPGDLRLMGVIPAGAEADWDWAKWLPHLRDQLGGDGFGRASRTFVTDADVFAKNVAALLGPRTELAGRAEASGMTAAPLAVEHAIAVIDGYSPRSPVGESRTVDVLLRQATRVKATVVVLVDSPAEVPARCDARVDLLADGSCSYRETSMHGRIDLGVTPEGLDRSAAQELARRLSPLQLAGDDAHADLVDRLRLTDLLGLEHAGELDAGQSWLTLADLARPTPVTTEDDEDASPTRPAADALLTAPIGVAADGATVVLDLKEAAAGGMGPHGILVGATGSGKSELLRTLTVSLAARHDPALLSFVLVDFKGGAAFAGLDQLPHVAGVITNLAHDLALVDRVREALTGELERRQEMLRAAGNFDSIRAYHAEAAAGADLPELPYLVVIVDEFGELLAARPEFLDTFVAIGRLGRSLGVHLMLATQRLDEGRIRGLEPHLRYRACLRTFSAMESQAVLGTAAAYELPPLPGLGYLKVDSGMSRFKASLVSTAYRPPAEQTFRQAVASELVRPFRLATPASEIAEAGDDVTVDLRRTDLSVLVEAMAEASGGRKAHQVWLPPLPPMLTLGDLFAGLPAQPHRLQLPIGLVDLPERQTQQPAVLDLSGSGGNAVVVGAPRTGKTTVLSSLVVSLTCFHTVDEAQVYVVDLAGGGLHALAELPHVGAVVGRHEPELIARLLREMRTLIEERAALARRHQTGTLDQLREKLAEHDGTSVPDTFLLIDGIGLLRANHPELEQEVGELAATGLQFGVHVVVGAARWLDIRPALLDALGTRLELRLNDPIDSMAGKAKSAALPDLPGRGLTRAGSQFQAALPALSLSAALGAADTELRRVAALLTEQEGDRHAPRIAPLPERVRPRDIPALAAVSGSSLVDDDREGFLLGVQEFRTSPIRLDLLAPGAHLLVYGDGESGRTTVLRRATEHLLATAGRRGSQDVSVHIVDVGRGLIDLASSDGVDDYAFTADQALTLAGSLAKLLADRRPPADLTIERLRQADWWSGPQHVLVVDDYDLLLGPAGGPFTELLEALGQARDIGLHVLLARRASGSQRTAFEPFGQRLREVGVTGLVLSGPTSEGPLINDVAARPQQPGRGFLVRPRERTAVVQCCVSDDDAEGTT
jgi:S-DNA-T family DNA segregation ATPase FtsK/SpoIIIE